MTLVCFALPFESAAFRKKIGARSDVEVLHTGMGASAAGEALRGRIGVSRPDRIISSGFAGALNPELRAGDLIVASNLSSPEWLAGISNTAHALGTLHTHPDVVATVDGKSALRRQTGADAVDMESGALAKVATDFGIPMLTVRSISDDAQTAMVAPPTVLGAAANDGVRGTLCLLRWLAIRPRAWRPFSRFVNDTRQAQQSLANLIEFLD